MSVEAQSANADTTDESADERPIYPQVTQHPHSVIVGEEIVDIVTSANIDSSQEKTGSGVGVVFKNPTVAEGTLWKQRDLPEGFDSASEFNTTVKKALADEGDWVNGVEMTGTDIDAAVSRVDAALEDGFDPEEDTYRNLRLPVDYKVADPSDPETEVQEISGETLGIDVGGGAYGSEQVDDFDHDEIMVWYGSLAGQFILNALDFNGRPSARFKDDGYLVKGLMQHPLGWFDRDSENYDPETTNRSKLARSADNGGLGRPPRVARPPVLREDIEGEEVFIEIYREDGKVFQTTAFNDFEGDDVDDATVIEPNYATDRDRSDNNVDTAPENVLCEEFDVDVATEVYGLFHGDGWQPKIEGDGAQEDTSGASFDVDMDEDDEAEEVSHPTEDERQFAHMVAEQLAGTGKAPEENVFTANGDSVDLEGLVGHNADAFNVTPDVDSIRRVVYENVGHLNTDDLGSDE